MDINRKRERYIRVLYFVNLGTTNRGNNGIDIGKRHVHRETGNTILSHLGEQMCGVIEIYKIVDIPTC